MPGKVCLELAPPANHFWNVTFRLNPRGMNSVLLPYKDHPFAFHFDFIDHQLEIACADGRRKALALGPMTVAEFYKRFLQLLRGAEIEVKIWPVEVEVPDPLPFKEDTAHHDYEAPAAHDLWRAMISMAPVFEEFRCSFVGKVSPLHFFWGGFDLALTRFSGRRAPPRIDGPMNAEAYSHEVISHGFWPGSGAIQEPAFYAYAAPPPQGLAEARISPAEARYVPEMGLFVLPYEAVRSSSPPERKLRQFLDSTYSVAADLAGWNRAELER